MLPALLTSPFSLHRGFHVQAPLPQSPPWCPKASSEPPLLHLHLLEAPHAVQDVKLLPALGKVHFAVNVIRVSQMDKGQVLQNQASGRGKGAAGQGSRQTDTKVSHTRQGGQPEGSPTKSNSLPLPPEWQPYPEGNIPQQQIQRSSDANTPSWPPCPIQIAPERACGLMWHSAALPQMLGERQGLSSAAAAEKSLKEPF